MITIVLGVISSSSSYPESKHIVFNQFVKSHLSWVFCLIDLRWLEALLSIVIYNVSMESEDCGTVEG